MPGLNDLFIPVLELSPLLLLLLLTFFGSVFSTKIKNDVPASYECLPELCLDNVTFSETEIRTLLLRCDDSSSMGADNIPSFVLREYATILYLAVQQLFYCVTTNCTWPILEGIV